MVLKTIEELNEYIEATGVVYNHSNTKLISRKSKVKRSRREAFLSLLPYRRLSSHHHHAENKPFTKQKSKSKPIVESATSKTRQKLQVSVRSQLPHGSKTLDFEVDPDTSVSSLKELIHRRIGVLPQRQHLHIGNVPLLDFLTLHENGVDKKEIISLSTDDLTPEDDDDGATPQEEEKVGKTDADDGATPQEEEKVGKTDADDGATPQEEEKVGKTDADDGATPCLNSSRCIKQNLQVFVQNLLLRGPKTLCFQLNSETSVSFLKEIIHKMIGVQPKHQCLCIRRNMRSFQLHDLRTLNDCGLQQDETILLRLPTAGLLGGGPTGELSDSALCDISMMIQPKKLMRLGIKLGFSYVEVSQIDTSHSGIADKILELLIDWRSQQPGDVNQTKALCKVLKEVGEVGLADNLAGGASLQSRQPSGGMSENQPSTSHQPAAQGAVLHSQIPVGTHTSLQPGQTSVDMPENQPSTSQQPTTQAAVSHPLTPECSTSYVQSQAAAAKCKGALKEHYITTDFQRLPQTEQHVSGSGNIPINNPTDCTINIYPSKGGAHTSLQPGQTSVDMSENQPSTSQQPTTSGAVSHPLFTLNLGFPIVNIQIVIKRNWVIDVSLTVHLLQVLTYAYDRFKARPFIQSIGELLCVKRGCVVFVVRISSRASLEKLWTMYTSGELAKKLTELFITDELTTEDKTDLSIQVTIQESDYDRACRFFEELERASYEDLTHQLSGDMLENQPSTPQQPTTQGAVSHPLTPDVECSTSDVQSQDIYKKEEMRDPNDVAKQDTNKKQTDGNRVNPPSDSQETPRQGEQQSTRSETQDFSVKSSSQHKRTAQEQDSQQGTLSSRARQGEAGKLDHSSLYSLSKQISAKKWTELAIKLGFDVPEVTHFKAEHPSDVVRQFFDMLVEWRNRQPGDINQTEALCKALKEVGETRLADNLAECSTSDVQSQVATKCKDALKERYECTGAYVPLNPWLGEHKKHFVEIYTRLQLAKARDREKLMQGLESLTESKSKDRLVSYEDILLLKTETGKLIQIAVLSGLAGRGKTTLLDKIALDWATGCSQVLQKYELVFLLNLCYLEQVSSLIDAVFGQFLFAEGAFKDTEKDALMSYIQENADKVLFLLDGFDELKTTSLSNPILKILNRKLFRGCTVLVSTRPSHFDRLVSKELVQEPYTHVRVLGFNTEDMRDYVKRYYSDEPDKAEGLLEKIQSSNNFSTLAESPMLLLLMCLLWREDSTLPETMSQLYQRAIKYIGKRKDISKEEMSRVLIALGQVSLCGLLSQDQELTFQESGFEQSVLDTALKVGIVTRQTVFKSKSLEPHSIVQFIHKTFQEFSAAAYLRNISKADTKTFHDTVNEIMSKDPLAFGYLLRFCCGDNEACTLEILKVFQERHQKDLSFISEVGQLALHCYFEGQCKCLPPEEFIHSFLTDHIAIQNLNDDSGNSVRYFVQRIAKETRDSGRAYLADVKSVIISSDSVHVSHIVEAFSGLPNLVTLELYGCRLCGTAVSWGKQLRQCKALQELDLRWCFLNGQDMVHVAESLSGLPNLHTLDLIHSDLGGTAVSLVKQLGQCKALQHLGLSDCSLNGKKMVHVAESLSGLPYLVTLKLSWNDLGGKAALWGKQLGQCKTLQDLDLSGCKLNGQDMVHVAESLSGLPYLVTLKLSWNDLGGKAALWCKQLGQCKALRDLDLSGCKLNGQDMVHVAESLNSLPNLVRLRLIKNDLGGVAALFCAELKQFKALEYLMLGDREVTEKEKRHINELLAETNVEVNYW